MSYYVWSRDQPDHCKEGEFKSHESKTTRLYPATSQTSDQQLDDAVAAILEFKAQALAKEF